MTGGVKHTPRKERIRYQWRHRIFRRLRQGQEAAYGGWTAAVLNATLTATALALKSDATPGALSAPSTKSYSTNGASFTVDSESKGVGLVCFASPARHMRTVLTVPAPNAGYAICAIRPRRRRGLGVPCPAMPPRTRYSHADIAIADWHNGE